MPRRQRIRSAETGKPIEIKAVRPNVGIRNRYHKRLDTLVRQMQADVERQLTATWREKQPEINELTRDASPAMTYRTLMKRLAAKWQARFDDLSQDMAAYFATSASQRVDATLKAALRKSGFAIEFKATAAQNDAYQAVIGENVGLIRSISSEYLQEVEGLVMRAVQAGGDLKPLTDALERRYGITRRRAALIAQDQNSKATAVFTRVRQLGLGIEKARWLHSAGGHVPRPSHVKASKDRVEYDIAEGWLDPATGKRIWPGTEINCRCVPVSIINGIR